MNSLRCRGIQLGGSRRERSELRSSEKERNTAHEIPRLADKGAKKHSEGKAEANLSVLTRG